MATQPLTAEQKSEILQALAAKKLEIDARRGNPTAQAEAADNVINNLFQTRPDGVDAETGFAVDDDDEDEQLEYVCANTENLNDVFSATYRQTQKAIDGEHKMLNLFDRKPATPQTVQAKIVKFPVGDHIMPDWVKKFAAGLTPPEPEEVKQAKQTHAQSQKTDVKPEVEAVRYSKDTCSSQGETINYKVAMKRVEWGSAIKQNSKSPEESIEHLVSYLTNFIRDSYGGWGRITEIIVRDQHLIINRTCMRPVIDPKAINTDVFPLDAIDYLQEGAIAAFFDWSMLKHMKNLMCLDVDDMGFYEVNIGGRLKCGRRIGVSTLFNLCPSLDVLILAGDAVTRDSLNTEEATVVKKKLATHKRFNLFSDGFKLNIMQNTNSFAGWTFGNMKNYACNRGNKNIFIYCGGVVARAGMAGAAGVLNLGAHLVGGIFGTIKQAMTPVNPDEVGLQ